MCGDFPDVEVQMDSMKLENARDILPKIIDIFTNIKEIADEKAAFQGFTNSSESIA